MTKGQQAMALAMVYPTLHALYYGKSKLYSAGVLNRLCPLFTVSQKTCFGGNRTDFIGRSASRNARKFGGASNSKWASKMKPLARQSK